MSVASLGGMTEPFVERRIREAIERGELEPREGVGEPIPNLDEDPDWWACAISLRMATCEGVWKICW